MVYSILNAIEHSLITATDTVAPLIIARKVTRVKPCSVSPSLRGMCNRRKYLLKYSRKNNDGRHAVEIRDLNKNIREYFSEKRRRAVRCATNGPKGSIWRAVGLAKDLNPDAIPYGS